MKVQVEEYIVRYHSALNQAISVLSNITGISRYMEARKEFGNRIFKIEEEMETSGITLGDVIYNNASLDLKLRLFDLDVDMNMKSWGFA